ncbi:MAG: hypothetical protein HC769_00660 [Cyanobacteria bacterium CRU_2_1]|nr:hypothetical protein [Cyanobacteria bacterium CRU_2_1]
MNNRVWSRLLHLVASAALGIFIYSPWRSNPTFDLVMSYGVFPFLALTGVWMWQAPRLKKVFKRSPAFSTKEKGTKVRAS